MRHSRDNFEAVLTFVNFIIDQLEVNCLSVFFCSVLANTINLPEPLKAFRIKTSSVAHGFQLPKMRFATEK